MVDVTVATDIRAPLERVASFTADPDNTLKWYRNITSVEWLTPRPARVGTRVRFAAQFLGRRLSYTYEIVEHAPSLRFVMRTHEGPFPMETTYEWSETARGTHMTLRNRGGPAGFSRMMAPFLSAAMRRTTTADLAQLKSLLEGD